MKSIPYRVAAVLVCVCSSLGAATFTVTTTADSGPGTLREAIINANASVGQDRIHFNLEVLPYQIIPATSLPALTDAVIIDGSTQPGFEGAPIVELSGQLLAAGANGLVINTTNSTVQGLVINLFQGAGISIQTNGNNVITGNFIGTDRTGMLGRGNGSGITVLRSKGNRVGGTLAQERNLISGNSIGIQLLGATQNLIVGNDVGTGVSGQVSLGNGIGILVESNCIETTIGGAVKGAKNLICASTNEGVRIVAAMENTVSGNYIGTDRSGSAVLGNKGHGVLVKDGAQYNMIGGTGATNGNVIAGNQGAGVRMEGAATSENFVLGNYIGIKGEGGSALANSNGVALVNGATINTIGGPFADGNVVSGNKGCGIVISGAESSDNLIQGNFIGVGTSGKVPMPNLGPGIWLRDGAPFNQVGGAESGQGNTIAYNAGDGVLVEDQDTIGNLFYGNFMFGNAGLGINLKKAGEPNGSVTANDVLDEDTGPNNLQNVPVITNLVYTAGETVIQGLLSSQPNNSYVLDFYRNRAPEASGSGEGEFYLGYTNVTTDAMGVARFAFNAGRIDTNQYVTATATDQTWNDTSEFSAAFGGFMFLYYVVKGSDFEVKFTTTPGLYYRLEKSPLSVPISWTPVANATRIAGTGNVMTATDSGGAGQNKMFYRLVIVP